MYLRTTIDRIPWSTSRPRNSTNGQCKNRESQKLAITPQCARSTKIPRIHRILQILHTKLLTHCLTTTQPNTEDNPVALGRPTTRSIWSTTKCNVWQTSTKTTRLHQTIHCINWHIGLWRESYTLTRGRIWPTKTLKETQITPCRVLFGHLHTHWKRLRHIRMRTTSHHQSNHTLETVSHMDRRTIHNQNRSHEPTLLEIT